MRRVSFAPGLPAGRRRSDDIEIKLHNVQATARARGGRDVSLQKGRPAARTGRPNRVGATSMRQCAIAPSAPIPVCERTNCASKAARSLAAAADVSVTEKIHVQRNASGMVKMAGEA